MQISLSLQWVDKDRAAGFFGRQIAVGSFASIVTFGLIWVAFDLAGLDYHWAYLMAGGLAAGIAVVCWGAWPSYPEKVRQHRHMVLRRRYWLYYLLIFMSGARRQIFIVFAGFLMVEKFGYTVGEITLLFLLNRVINVFWRPNRQWVGRIGDRKALILEYARPDRRVHALCLRNPPWVAAGLYVIDHLFFALAIAIKTYFQKIADPADIAPTAGVGFTINHIAAVVIPAAFGLLWLVSPAAVFLAGAAMAALSLLLAINVPTAPEPGNEALLGRRLSGPAPVPGGQRRSSHREVSSRPGGSPSRRTGLNEYGEPDLHVVFVRIVRRNEYRAVDAPEVAFMRRRIVLYVQAPLAARRDDHRRQRRGGAAAGRTDRHDGERPVPELRTARSATASSPLTTGSHVVTVDHVDVRCALAASSQSHGGQQESDPQHAHRV